MSIMNSAKYQAATRLTEELHEKVSSNVDLTEVSELTSELAEKVANISSDEEPSEEQLEEVDSIFQRINHKLREILSKSETGKILIKELIIKLLVEIFFHLFF